MFANYKTNPGRYKLASRKQNGLSVTKKPTKPTVKKIKH